MANRGLRWRRRGCAARRVRSAVRDRAVNVRLRLTERWVDHVRGLPETGMGYQIVDVVLRNGERFRGIVVRNAEEMEWPSGAGEMVPEDIAEIWRSRVRP